MNIVEIIRTTADNHHELMYAIADHIEELEAKLAKYEPTPKKKRQRMIKPIVPPEEQKS